MKKMTVGFMGGMLVLLLLTGCSGTGLCCIALSGAGKHPYHYAE